MTYDTFGQLIEEQQEHGGAVSGSTLKVQYGFDPGATGSNVSGPVTLTCPQGRILTYNHGTSGGMSGALAAIGGGPGTVALGATAGFLGGLIGGYYTGRGATDIATFSQNATVTCTCVGQNCTISTQLGAANKKNGNYLVWS